MRLVVLAAGNEARGDDAIGPRLLAAVEARGDACVRTVYDFQFQVEHALELEAADLALFIDCHCDQAEPVRLVRVTPDAAIGASSHALSPAQVLAVFGRVCARPAPPVFVLSVAGEDFELGAPLSLRGEAACARADRLLERLLAQPEVHAWDRAAAEVGAC